MKKKNISVIRIIGIVLVTGAVLISLITGLPSLMGYKSYAVTSGSMEPAINVGDVIYAKSVDPEELVKGDIITYYSNGITVTHRISDIDTDNRQFITKGDNNGLEDIMPVDYDEVIGKVVYYTNTFGPFITFLSTFTGKMILFGMLLGGFILWEIGDHIR
ncbi:MAG: signal peptidase I [Erysipelotrichaceae bacterium]|nr:signal peptidase I [Erysipelotrichaceae bacterium]